MTMTASQKQSQHTQSQKKVMKHSVPRLTGRHDHRHPQRWPLRMWIPPTSQTSIVIHVIFQSQSPHTKASIISSKTKQNKTTKRDLPRKWTSCSTYYWKIQHAFHIGCCPSMCHCWEFLSSVF